MNHYGIQQKNTLASSCDETRNAVSVSVPFDKGEHMVCPKPRRLSLFDIPMNEPVRPLRWHMCYPPKPYESKADLELLEIIFEKGGGYRALENARTQVAASPPFFSGSPPSRVSNPLTQDTKFGDDNISPVSRHPLIRIPASGMSSPSSSEMKGGLGCVNFGHKPAIRIEGFDCLARDDCRNHNHNCSIAALA